MQRRLRSVTLALIVTAAFFMHAWANVPAPPANQQTGTQDSVFHVLVESDCRFCHENPDQFPVKPETIPHRHHLLVGQPVADPTARPFPEGDIDGNYDCFSCHELIWDPVTMSYQLYTFRDCLFCHQQTSDASVHHLTDLALGNLPQGPDCQACHGSLVNNIEDGHFIPSSPVSDSIPRRSAGTGLPLNSEGNGRGACNYCHSTGTGDPAIPGIDAATGISVYSNKDTHHQAGFGAEPGPQGSLCHWCHDFDLPFEEQIRVCENCHGLDSLHNIQVDSDGDGVINPGDEIPGYGHIGDGNDCMGCHAVSHHGSPELSASSIAPDSGPVIPHISSISATVLTSGKDNTVTLGGSGFTNISESVELMSNVIITSHDGHSIEVIPDLIDESSLTFTIPDTLANGNYLVRAGKLDKFSNPVVVSIKPDVSIHDVTCYRKRKILTIAGTGFGEKPEGTDAHINVEVDNVKVDIISWHDTEIRVTVPRCSKNAVVTVNGLFGSATYSNRNKPDKPCKRREC